MNPFTLVYAIALVAPLPEWIWNDEEREGAGDAEFSRSLELPDKPRSARLTATADFARLEVRINGKTLARVEAYDPSLSLEIASSLLAGEN
ncbi:MAG: hypothetical protein AAGH89_01345, partial [Verrucomicrobiota bacterium]